MRPNFVKDKRQEGWMDFIKFMKGDSAMMRTYTSSDTKWTKGYVVDRLGKLHYTQTG